MIKLKQLLSEGISNQLLVYHGSREKFDRFDINSSAQGIIWFTSNIDNIINGESGAAGNKFIATCKIRLKNPVGWDDYEKLALGQLKGMGYDGGILEDDYFIFSPSQVKILKWNKLNGDI